MVIVMHPCVLEVAGASRPFAWFGEGRQHKENDDAGVLTDDEQVGLEDCDR